jgi:YVTN family beta-propeller protein
MSLTPSSSLSARALTLAALISAAVPASSDAPAGRPPSHPASPRPVITLAPDEPLPGMPPVTDKDDIYAATRANKLSPAVKDITPRIYVPNSVTNSVTVIDPATYKVIGSFPVGRQPQHVTPSWDMKTLWVLNDLGDSLTAIDPATGAKGKTIPVMDPYNMYYTPDGKYAIVVAERLKRLDFRDAATMKMVNSVKVPCRGVDHMDFSANGRYLIASCEFSGEMVKVDVAEQKVMGVLKLPTDHVRMAHGHNEPPHAAGKGKPPARTMQDIHDSIMTGGPMPQDVKLSPDGKVFYVADMASDGVHMVDGVKLEYLGFIPTGRGAHGLYTSRDSKYMYVSNRGEGSVSLIDLHDRKVAKVWKIPGGGSPDMGGVSADGKVLWLTGRYHGEVYAFDTENDGKLLARIKVGKGPHGLCVFPQPGRYSLGHTGVFR